MSEYLKMPWSEEVTVENLKSAKEIIKNLVTNINLDGMGEEDAEEVEFDFNRAIEALEKQIPKKPEVLKNGNLACKCGLVVQVKNVRKCLYCCDNCGQCIDWGDEE